MSYEASNSEVFSIRHRIWRMLVWSFVMTPTDSGRHNFPELLQNNGSYERFDDVDVLGSCVCFDVFCGGLE